MKTTISASVNIEIAQWLIDYCQKNNTKVGTYIGNLLQEMKKEQESGGKEILPKPIDKPKSVFELTPEEIRQKQEEAWEKTRTPFVEPTIDDITDSPNQSLKVDDIDLDKLREEALTKTQKNF